ncbi:hypothetical protein CSUB01_10316 [Colletotrichum sublineola]|uniref:Uncharacterized protein n=1 Tax=Colletotrichum sublineola TaxID=1173701 RepID=A0A066X1S8_COLSU|nr:hypothetical protein CSUB01_10316 [Colletotrichum sublineola]
MSSNLLSGLTMLAFIVIFVVPEAKRVEKSSKRHMSISGYEAIVMMTSSAGPGCHSTPPSCPANYPSTTPTTRQKAAPTEAENGNKCKRNPNRGEKLPIIQSTPPLTPQSQTCELPLQRDSFSLEPAGSPSDESSLLHYRKPITHTNESAEPDRALPLLLLLLHHQP